MKGGPRAGAHLPEDKEHSKDDERDVGDDEVARVPVAVEEDCARASGRRGGSATARRTSRSEEGAGRTRVAVEDDDEDDGDEAEVRGVGLERRLEGEVVARDALVLEAVVEPDVRVVDARPGDEASDGREATRKRASASARARARERGREQDALREVVEGRRRAGRHVHVGEQADGGRDDDAVDGETALGAAAEDGRRLSVAGEAVERPRRGVQVRVARREGREEHRSVDDRRQALDARVSAGRASQLVPARGTVRENRTHLMACTSGRKA